MQLAAPWMEWEDFILGEISQKELEGTELISFTSSLTIHNQIAEKSKKQQSNKMEEQSHMFELKTRYIKMKRNQCPSLEMAINT